MPTLYGRRYSVQELRRRVGQMSQLAGIRSSTLDEGMAQGVRVLDFHTGSGLRFSVLPDRGMDLGAAEWRGVPLVWHSPTGPIHPAYYEQEGLGWLRGFYGGLMVTCGFMNVAVPSEDEGLFYGMHGRASYSPASNVGYEAQWEGERYMLRARGQVREVRVFGENVLLTRTIETELGSNTITIEDTVENQGFESTPYMILYHVNAGFPVLDEDSELLLNSQVTPRDEEAAIGLDVAKRGAPPTPGFQEQVHQHDVMPGPDGYTTAALVNRSFRDTGIGLMVRYRPQELPYFWQWRMVGQGTYVMGLEPANCHVMGRGEERRQGRLPFLEAGEMRTQRIQLRVLTTPQEIDEVEQTVKGG